jgi:hypothetical protein
MNNLKKEKKNPVISVGTWTTRVPFERAAARWGKERDKRVPMTIETKESRD